MNKYIYLGVAAAALLASCSNDDDWTPGPDYNTTDQIVVTTPTSDTEVSPGESWSAELTYTRPNTQGSLKVPLTVSDRTNFTVPEAVEFADGEAVAVVPVAFNGSDVPGTFVCSVTVEMGQFNSPYAVEDANETLTVMVIDWEVVNDNTRVYSYFAYLPDSYRTLLHGKGTNLYRIAEFFEGYDLTFAAEASSAADGYSSDVKYIKPRGGVYQQDYLDWGYDVWYFNPDGIESEMPMKWPTDPDHMYDYCFIGVDKSFLSYILPESGWGLFIWDFCQYDLAGNYTLGTYDYLYFVF